MDIKLIVAFAASISLSACATVTKGSNDTVKMTSQPSEAKVVFDDTTLKYQPKSCYTPCEIELNRKRTYNATVSKAGYEDFVVVMVPKVSTSGGTAMAGNLLLGGVIGAGVDGLTGAMKDLSPNNLDVILAPTGGVSYALDKDQQKIENMKARAISSDMKTETKGTLPKT
jgi:hypothetical protein